MDNPEKRRRSILTRELPDDARSRRYRKFAGVMLVLSIVIVTHVLRSAGGYVLDVWTGLDAQEWTRTLSFALQFAMGAILLWVTFLGSRRSRAPTAFLLFVLVALMWASVGVGAIG